MPNLHTCEFYLASEVLTTEDLNALAECPSITFGDANRTLVSVHRIINVIGVPEKLAHASVNDYVDLEN